VNIEEEAKVLFGGTFEEDSRDILTVNGVRTIKEEKEMLEFMNDYAPSKITDGYAVIKGQGKANFNHARIEEYSGDKEDWKGKKFIRYELQICDGEENAGRRFWKSVDITDEAKVKKFADMLWTVTGFDFKDEETLLKALEQLVTFTVDVKYWGFTTEEEKALAAKESREPEKIQTHIIKSQAKVAGESKKSDVPF
jgi:hypothetical protein